ncbi:YdcF family protein [Bacillaceae bacterium SIJ1]|uniref:YdcF family protein n=1 Tax=Litoribacterium kuwaitense TaxID=1398745 RepID=UPI0013ECC16E|nr:YdcF family protein [Litoribacterium kuwaitense]NGP45703.1 YdcF family protein [Litoribacterium kuwaitense]
MYISQLEAEKLSDQQMTNLLFKDIKDNGKSGECIFVAGSSKAVLYRLPKAVQLYEEGRARKMLFSGGVVWDGNERPEAITLKKEAMGLGVPETAILTEDLSLHTKENVLASLLVLDRAFSLHHIERILVVTTFYHMRRLHLTLKTYMPHWIEYTLCPVNDKMTRPDGWFHTEIGRKRVKEECTKLIKYVKQGALLDMDVNI